MTRVLFVRSFPVASPAWRQATPADHSPSRMRPTLLSVREPQRTCWLKAATARVKALRLRKTARRTRCKPCSSAVLEVRSRCGWVRPRHRGFRDEKGRRWEGGTCPRPVPFQRSIAQRRPRLGLSPSSTPADTPSHVHVHDCSTRTAPANPHTHRLDTHGSTYAGTRRCWTSITRRHA